MQECVHHASSPFDLYAFANLMANSKTKTFWEQWIILRAVKDYQTPPKLLLANGICIAFMRSFATPFIILKFIYYLLLIPNCHSYKDMKISFLTKKFTPLAIIFMIGFQEKVWFTSTKMLFLLKPRVMTWYCIWHTCFT